MQLFGTNINEGTYRFTPTDHPFPPAHHQLPSALPGLQQTEKALSLLREMRAAQGVRTNMASYRAVMYAYSRAGDWASALGLLEDARREELQPTTGDLRTLVQVIGRLKVYFCVFL